MPFLSLIGGGLAVLIFLVGLYEIVSQIVAFLSSKKDPR